jgi:histidinol-phosphate/aromatic aminotransferase/cobyric acid decarboxylase-like protein/choline kinase
MQALILAAGHSQRMRQLSRGMHKTLLPIAGTTILGRMVDQLLAVGTEVITVVTGHAEDQITKYLCDQFPDAPLQFVHNDRFARTNNVVSLAVALDKLTLEDDLLLMECDILADHRVLTRLVEHPAPNVALVERYRTGMDGTVVTIRDGVISGVIPRHRQGRNFDYADAYKTLNMYRFSAGFVANVLRPLVRCYADDIDPRAQYEDVLRMLCGDPAHPVAVDVVTGEKWVEVDDPNDVLTARFQFEPHRRSELLEITRGGYWNFDLLDFAMMRNAYFPTEPMLAMMRHALPDLISNYGSTQSVLNRKLAYVLGCAADRVQALHGATQAYPIVAQLWAGRSAAIPDPTFGEYPRIFPRACRYLDEPGQGWRGLDDLAAEVDVCVIVNPNNPTGFAMPTAELHALAAGHPETMFLVDESFQAFTSDRSLLDRLESEPLANVAVLTSLSKSLGAPGLRLGYLYSTNRALVEAVGAQLPIWNLSAQAEHLLELLLKFRQDLVGSFALTIADREELAAGLGGLDVVDRVYPSGGNFLLVQLAGDDGTFAAQLRDRLLTHELIDVKDVTDRFPDERPRLRIAVRLPHENARLLHAIRRATQAAHPVVAPQPAVPVLPEPAGPRVSAPAPRSRPDVAEQQRVPT